MVAWEEKNLVNLFYENIDQSTTYVPVAACQLETAQFTATSDISVRDLWFIPGIAICT